MIIKFRVYDFKKKEMIIPFKGAKSSYALDYWDTHTHVSEPMQYVGQLMESGVDLYEKDIVKFKVSKKISEKKWLTGEIIRVGAKYIIWSGCRHYDIADNIIERLGNRFENPELMKVGEK